MSIDKNSRLRILVLGYIVRGPMGGMTWHHLQYVLGLRQIGHEVYFLEDSGDSEYCCYDPVRNVTDKDPSYGLQYAKQVFDKTGLENKWGYYDKHRNEWQGPVAKTVFQILKDADLLLNLSCSNALRPWFQDIPVKTLVDTDPVFTQIRNLTDKDRFCFSKQHDRFFTFGENFGSESCQIPDDGIAWKPTRQPVVLNAWPFSYGRHQAAFTSIMKWESYPGKNYNGHYYGMKAESFDMVLDIPEKTTSSMEMAVSDSNAPRQKLMDKGWRLAYPQKISGDPWKYQQYIQQSKAEFSIAKHGYVAGKTGWFSERSCGYLASGRPVILQDTGFSRWLNTGLGVLAFTNEDEALAAIDEINTNYIHHCCHAREIAENFFSSEKVLSQLIENSFQ